MSTLKEQLNQWRSDDIKEYMYLLQGSSHIARKAERIDYICTKLLHKPTLRTIWAQLDKLSQRAISVAYHNGGVFDAEAFVAQYDSLPKRPQKESTRYYSYRKTPILFDIFIISEQIPTDLMPLLADLVLPTEQFKLTGLAEAPTQIKDVDRQLDVVSAETEHIGRADLLTYLQMVAQKQVKFGAKNRRLTAASIRKVLANLSAGGFRETDESVTGRSVIRPFGLDVFTQESGLMTRTGKLTKAGRDYLHTQDSEIMLAAFEKWTESGKFDELSRIQRLGGLKSRSTRLTPVASRREKVIEALSWCPVDVWIDMRDFYRAIKVWGFDFKIEKSDYSNLYIGSQYYSHLYQSNYWELVNGLYIKALIWEYLGTLGLVDVIFFADQYATLSSGGYEYVDEPISLFDGLCYFRINRWGAFLLGQADTYIPTQPQAKALFTIDAALKVVVSAELQPYERFQLEAMARPIDAQTYQLDQTILLTSVEGGQSLEQLSAFLQAHHQGELPPSVAAWLSQLQQNQGVFKQTGEAILIQISQPDLFMLTQQDKLLAKVCRKIDSKTILVTTAHLARFRKRLKELGYLLD